MLRILKLVESVRQISKQLHRLFHNLTRVVYFNGAMIAHPEIINSLSGRGENKYELESISKAAVWQELMSTDDCPNWAVAEL